MLFFITTAIYIKPFLQFSPSSAIAFTSQSPPRLRALGAPWQNSYSYPAPAELGI